MDEVLTDEQQQQQSNEVLSMDDARQLVQEVAQDAASRAVDAVNVQQVAQDAANSAADGIAGRVDAAIAPVSSGLDALKAGNSGADDVAVTDDGSKDAKGAEDDASVTVTSLTTEQWDYIQNYVKTTCTVELFGLLVSCLLVGVLLFREFSQGWRR